METAAAQKSTFAFNAENEAKFQALVGKYPTKQAVVLPALWLVIEQQGWVSTDAMDYVARRLEQAPVAVYAVVEFYTMFLTSPPGRHHIQLCHTLTCTMRGCEDLQAQITEETGIGPGEKSEDGLFSFETVECLGSCGTAPMMRMGNRYYENLTREKLARVIRACREERDPAAEDHD
ncbi:MAG: NAD(P)H-dependent oxidoreductase subunit E [Candidatus Krumholzibacteria bacterium]|nr:NAD(P)H-dependent oxidoreductase subunit E [Candidatus Krumholzibacteria bacterium]